jgi:hypothetical protein
MQDGTEAGDGFYCQDCRSHRNYGFGECDHGYENGAQGVDA